MSVLLVTGANGFVGRQLCARLEQSKWWVRQAHRQPQAASQVNPWQDRVYVGEISTNTDWRRALADVNCVVHLAARVHVMKEQCPEPLIAFRRVNVAGTENLARQAADAGVRRFIYLSSIKVNGEFTEVGRPFTAADEAAPQDPYGVSKLEAEEGLRQVAVQTGMEMVIIRPPLVYGPGVKANFESMMRWLTRGIPLPLAAVTSNRRSLVALDNLVDLIVTCLSHPAAANQTFLVSDGEDLSTADLLRRMGAALGKPARLFYMPPRLLMQSKALPKIDCIYQRLCGSLQVDIAKTQQLLGWKPPLSVDEGLRRAAERFRS